MGAERRIQIPEVFNARDLGGLPIRGGAVVRRGLLFRAGELSEVDSEGAAMLAELGLRTVVDLRTDIETRERPDQLTGTGAALRAIPMLPLAFNEIPTDSSDLYTYISDFCTHETGEAFKALAAPGALPALFHCAVGKDRTGFLAGVILTLLGVPREDIIEDFLLSNAELGLSPQSGAGEPVPQSVPATESAPKKKPRYMARHAIRAELLADALDRILKQHGSIENYLRAGGVTDLDIESLRTAVVERA